MVAFVAAIEGQTNRSVERTVLPTLVNSATITELQFQCVLNHKMVPISFGPVSQLKITITTIYTKLLNLFYFYSLF